MACDQLVICDCVEMTHCMHCTGRTQEQVQAEARAAMAAAKQKTRVSQKKVDEVKVGSLQAQYPNAPDAMPTSIA